jgi:dipeptidyl aminopeptidase/acylaminoacyl peptidase
VPEDIPVVVNVHGGPESQSRPLFAPVTQYLLGRGYAVFAPNVRGSTGYGKAYTHLDDVYLRMDSVEDLTHASTGCVAGSPTSSRDGRLLRRLHGARRAHGYPELWTAGVDIVGIANMVTFLENTGSYRRALREPEYGSLERDRISSNRLVPYTRLKR